MGEKPQPPANDKKNNTKGESPPGKKPFVKTGGIVATAIQEGGKIIETHVLNQQKGETVV